MAPEVPGPTPPAGGDGDAPAPGPRWETYRPGEPARDPDQTEYDDQVGSGVSSGVGSQWLPTPPVVVIGGPVQAPPPHRGSASGLVVGLLVAAIVGAGVLVALVTSLADGDGATPEASASASASASTPPAQMHTPEGWRALEAALRAETGEARVFEAVLYPEYAVLQVPAQRTGARSHTYYFDGALRMTGKGTSSYQAFELGRVDPAVTARLLDRAGRELVEDPTTTYAILRRPDRGDDGWYSVYASNEYSESGYLQADLAGAVTYRYVSTE